MGDDQGCSNWSCVLILGALASYFLWYGIFFRPADEEEDSGAWALAACSVWVKIPLLTIMGVFKCDHQYDNRKCLTIFTPRRRFVSVRQQKCDCTGVTKAVAEGLATFLYAWFFVAPFVYNDSVKCIAGMLAFLMEGFCMAELRKTGIIPPLVLMGCSGRSMDFGFFKYVVAITVCTAQTVFGFWSLSSCLIFLLCLVLLSLHNIIPRTAYYGHDDRHICGQNYYYESNKSSSISSGDDDLT